MTFQFILTLQQEKAGNLVEAVKKYLAYDVLIIDDFGSHNLSPGMCRSLL